MKIEIFRITRASVQKMLGD